MFLYCDSWDTRQRDCDVVARAANLRTLKQRLGLPALSLVAFADALFAIAFCGARGLALKPQCARVPTGPLSTALLALFLTRCLALFFSSLLVFRLLGPFCR